MHQAAPDIEEIFFAALEIEGRDARSAFLDQACGDPELRCRVERLLARDAQASGFLESPAAPPTVTVESPSLSEGPGTVIGPYKLREQLGEGGMGVVYVAEQTQPVCRKVALKVIKPGMDSRQVVARFEAERQALAMMDHPNIARVFDGGTTPSGRPYFVMELVRGVPITDPCDEQKLTIRERLELFVLVCRAVQHAHQKGIIHRDLKPSNILITLHDGVPVPKIIDFGVAKATGQSLTDKTVYTAFTQLVGTPLYMSPEQVELSGLDIDTRSDIYSLGVLLYELLTGTTPFDAETLRNAAFDEMRRIIREQEPQRPSTRLRSLGETLTTVSARRQADPRRLAPSLRSELDWVVMKALEKDRRRRYESANDFASDVMRYLTDQPVEACPPSAGYRLRKFLRRNKGPVAAGLALAALLVLGTVGTSIGLVWALQAERAAIREKERATAAEAQAKEEADMAWAVSDFLTDDLLAEASPDKNAPDKKVTAEELLWRAAARIEGKFAGKPRIEAEIRLAIGTSYVRLGELAAGQPHLERALEIGRRAYGDEHGRMCILMNNLGLLYRDQGKLDQAEGLLVQALALGRRVLGEEHRDTLLAMNNLAALYGAQRKLAQAEPLLARATEANPRVLGEDHEFTLASNHNLARLCEMQGKLSQAESLLVKTLDVSRRVRGEENPDTLTFMTSLAFLYRRQRQFAQAEPLFDRALQVSRRVWGEEHRTTLLYMNNLAALYSDQGKSAQAERLLVQALAVSRRVLGEEDPVTLTCMMNLTRHYHIQGQHAQHEPLFVQTLEVWRRVRGEEHPVTLLAMETLAELYLDRREYSKAEPLILKVLEISRRARWDESPDADDLTKAAVLAGMNNLGAFYRDQCELTKAEPLYAMALEVGRRHLGEAHPGMLTAAQNLANLYWCDLKFERAIPLFEGVLKSTRDRSGPDHPDTLNAMVGLGLNYRDAGRLPDAIDILQWARAAALKPSDFPVGVLVSISTVLGQTYQRAGQLEKAESLCRETLQTLRQRPKEAPSQSADLQAILASILVERRRHAEAEPLLRECLKVREQNEPDFWRTFETKSLLGGSLLGQKKYAEAEPLLLAGCAGMKQREAKMEPIYRPRLTEAIDRLVRLYEVTGNKDKSAKWRAELAEAGSAKPAESKSRGSPSQGPVR